MKFEARDHGTVEFMVPGASYALICFNPGWVLQTGRPGWGSDSMIAVAEKRKYERIPLGAPIVLEDGRTGFKYKAKLCNYSAGGIYVQSEYALRPGRKLRIQTEMLSPDVPRCGSQARVRWRERLIGSSSTQLYGMGLQYC
jgi:PilZ domain